MGHPDTGHDGHSSHRSLYSELPTTLRRGLGIFPLPQPFHPNPTVALRKLGKAIGLMITASHNPPEDNGVKIVDWNGQMLPIECESHLDAMINMSDASFREKCIQYLDTDTMGSQSGEGARVIIGTDTRQSSPALLEEAMRGCRLVNLPVDIHGEDLPRFTELIGHFRESHYAPNPLHHPCHQRYWVCQSC